MNLDEEKGSVPVSVPLRGAQGLSDSQYASIGKTIHLLSAVEFELFRTLAAFGASEAELIDAARGTLEQRKAKLLGQIAAEPRRAISSCKTIFSRLDTASELRNQFTHGIWVRNEEKLICKFIKRNKNTNARIALQSIELPPDKFDLIHRNLEYLLVDLEILQELASKETSVLVKQN